MTISDQMDLLVEQVKMLAGDIAFSTSTLKRLIEQSVNDPEVSKTQAMQYSLFANTFLLKYFPCLQTYFLLKCIGMAQKLL